MLDILALSIDTRRHHRATYHTRGRSHRSVARVDQESIAPRKQHVVDGVLLLLKLTVELSRAVRLVEINNKSAVVSKRGTKSNVTPLARWPLHGRVSCRLCVSCIQWHETVCLSTNCRRVVLTRRPVVNDHARASSRSHNTSLLSSLASHQKEIELN